MSGGVIRNGLTGTTLGGGCASIAGNGVGAYLEAFASLDDYPNKRSQLVLFAPDAGGPHVSIAQTLDGQTWTASRLATATPPQEYALPLEAGTLENPGYRARYSKSQDGKVLIICNALKTSYFANGDTVCTMPAGYRCGPNNQKRSATITTIEGGIHPAKVEIEASTGRITLHYNAGVANVHQVDFEANYIAAS